MIQYIQCLKARTGMSISEFRTHFREYVEQMRRMAMDVGATRVEASTTLAIDANVEVMSNRGTQTPYDAVLEVYFPNASMLEALQASTMQERLDAIQRFQEEFVDLERSSFFFATVDEG